MKIQRQNSSKIFFQKANPLWGDAFKNRIHQPEQLE